MRLIQEKRRFKESRMPHKGAIVTTIKNDKKKLLVSIFFTVPFCLAIVIYLFYTNGDIQYSWIGILIVLILAYCEFKPELQMVDKYLSIIAYENGLDIGGQIGFVPWSLIKEYKHRRGCLLIKVIKDNDILNRLEPSFRPEDKKETIDFLFHYHYSTPSLKQFDKIIFPLWKRHHDP